VSPAPITVAAPARTGWRMPAIKAPYVFSSLITLILVVGQFKFGIVGGWERLLAALGTALAAEMLLGRLLRGKWPNVLSAYITGNSVVILSKPAPGLLWPYWLGSLVAISSKYVLTYRGRHLWNPTNFSFCALLLLAPHSMSLLSHQWGNSVVTWFVLGIGLLVVQRAKLMHISGTYALSFCVLGALRSLITGRDLLTEIAPITGPMYMLLMFFMLTDPRTVVSTVRGRMIVVVIIALVESLIRLLPETNFHGLDVLLTGPPIFALGIVGPIALWLELRRKARETPAPAAAAALPRAA
jgi:enediyne biosynthesis protein E5